MTLPEAQAAAAIASDHTVQIYDVGADHDQPWIAMEFIDGESLRQRISRDSLEPAEARRILIQILRGLTAIHEGGIVHRDLKPENILIGRDGIVRIADFGIAHVDNQVGLTTTGATFGTAAYMSPEQGLGESVTAACDIYATGVILFEMLTGRLPFPSSTMVSMLLAHQNQPVPALASVAPRLGSEKVLDAVVHQAMQKVPARRFQSARSMASALTQPAPIPTKPPFRTTPAVTQIMPIVRPVRQPSYPPQSKPGKAPWAKVFGFLVIASVVVLAGWYLIASDLLGSLTSADNPTAIAPTPTDLIDSSEEPGLVAPTIAPIATDVPTDIPIASETVEPSPTDVPLDPTETTIPSEPTIGTDSPPITDIEASPSPDQ